MTSTNPKGADHARFVQGMFARIAPRYDLLNRLMTAGQDVRWRREVIRRAALPHQGRLLDLGTGTGDLAREALVQRPDCLPVATDFTLKMMWVGRQRRQIPINNWAAADALRLPFPDTVFDAVVSGFLLRNVSDIEQVLQEKYRVLRPGGRIVSLDTTRPRQNLLYPLVQFQLHVIIPGLGRIISGEAEAYRYLPDTTENFLLAEELAWLMTSAGFRQVGFRRTMLGTIAIHWGVK